MKLFIVATLISAVAAARLEHLERGYLPPAQNNYGANSRSGNFPSAGAPVNFGFSSQGPQYSAQSRASNGFGGFGPANDFAAINSGPSGFGSNGEKSNFGNNGRRFNSISGRNGGSSAATYNQYLPPNYGASGLQTGSTFDSSIRSRCSTCGSHTLGSSQQYQQGGFRSQGLSIPSTQYSNPQYSIPPSHFGSQQDESVPVNRQYLAPKNSGIQSGPQQPFDENTGYIY